MSDPSPEQYPHGQHPQPPQTQPYGQQHGHGQPQGYGQQQPQGYYPPQYYQGPAAQRATNGLAIASMVLGIVWVYWIGSILALIFGYVARKQIRERNQSGDGMAIAGIVLGWVGVGFLLLVVAIGVVSSAAFTGY